MIVKLKANKKVPAGLEAGRSYPVLGIESDYYRIIDQTGRPYLYDSKAFSILDPEMPKQWVIEKGDEGETYAYPRQWMRPGFFEDFFDGNKKVIATFWRLVNGQLMHESKAPPARRASHQSRHAIS